MNGVENLSWFGRADLVLDGLRKALELTSKILPKATLVKGISDKEEKINIDVSLSETMLEKLSLAHTLTQSLLADIEAIYNKF